jgi:hypothetical protein
VNCSTDDPLELDALQPVQLVSMETVPGAMAKLEFDGEAMTPPAAQPASKIKAGARSRKTRRSGNLLNPWKRTHEPPELRAGRKELAKICASRGKIPILSSSSPQNPGLRDPVKAFSEKCGRLKFR